MAYIKEFFRKYELWVLIVATLLIIYALVFFNQKLNFFLGNELVVYLSPEQKSSYLHYGEIETVSFNVSTQNVAYCKSYCSYTFRDRSRNEILDKNSFEIGAGKHFSKSYNLSVKRLGSGQDIYNFEVKCRSIPSFFCHTKSPDKSRSSLVLVNYDLTQTEKELKQELKVNFTELLLLLHNVDVEHQKANQKYFELGHYTDLRNLTKQKIDIDDSYDKTRVSIENLRSLWSIENYAQLKQSLNRGYYYNLTAINKSIADFSRRIDSTVNLHNSILSQLSALQIDLNELAPYMRIFSNGGLLEEYSASANEFEVLSSLVINNTFDSYGKVLFSLNSLRARHDLLIQNSRIASTRLFFESRYLLDFENSLLCSLQGNCGNFSLRQPINKTESFFREFPQRDYLRSSCSSLRELNSSYSKIRSQSWELIDQNNISFNDDDDFSNQTENFMNNLILQINNSYMDSLQALIEENRTRQDIIDIAKTYLPGDKINSTYLFNSSQNISLHLLSRLNLSGQSLKFLNLCGSFENAPPLQQFDFRPVNSNINYKISANIDTNLSDNPPVCCVFNECKPCCKDDSCKNDPKTFPVIFVHGHSFARDNSPEYSLDAFNKLQSKLEGDGYLNAGIVSLYSKNEPLQGGIWSLSGKPITVKVSYYYDAFRREDKYILIPTKSENIDTYSLRLKDLIEVVKERTGKPKVNIIAHSMGGLVARRYAQVFGTGDIYKMVLIATPNNGITGKAASYCGYVGENRECQDMLTDSLFVNKLNDPSSQPALLNAFDVIGSGCQTDSRDGDGVVTTESARLANAEAFYVNGTCGGLFGGTLHTEILNIDLYPATYQLVKEILNK